MLTKSCFRALRSSEQLTIYAKQDTKAGVIADDLWVWLQCLAANKETSETLGGNMDIYEKFVLEQKHLLAQSLNSVSFVTYSHWMLIYFLQWVNKQ